MKLEFNISEYDYKDLERFKEPRVVKYFTEKSPKQYILEIITDPSLPTYNHIIVKEDNTIEVYGDIGSYICDKTLSIIYNMIIMGMIKLRKQ